MLLFTQNSHDFLGSQFPKGFPSLSKKLLLSAHFTHCLPLLPLAPIALYPLRLQAAAPLPHSRLRAADQGPIHITLTPPLLASPPSRCFLLSLELAPLSPSMSKPLEVSVGGTFTPNKLPGISSSHSRL